MQQTDYTWQLVFDTIQKSYAIEKHLDFFHWLTVDINSLIPHDAFLAAWGDFEQGTLEYDVTSKRPHLTTQALFKEPGVMTNLMQHLFQQWLDNDEKWRVLNNVDIEAMHTQLPSLFSSELCRMRSCLIYGVRDQRGQQDCLYVFFSASPIFQLQYASLGLLMPHVDAALRRVESLETEVTVSATHRDTLTHSGLTVREHEILHWVRSGKTNIEIGMILSISSNTVKNHLKRIFQKLNVSTRAQAVASMPVNQLN